MLEETEEEKKYLEPIQLVVSNHLDGIEINFVKDTSYWIIKGVMKGEILNPFFIQKELYEKTGKVFKVDIAQIEYSTSLELYVILTVKPM